MPKVENILEQQYKEGMKIIRLSKSSQEMLEELKKDCAHVSERDLVSLFKSVAAGTKMVDPAIIASAHNMEYNATHPPVKQRPWIDIFFTDAAKKIMTPKKIIKKTKTYAELIDAISALEEKYDDNKPPDTAVFKRRITTFLRKHGGKK
jgi:hypothetical protein